MTGDLRKSAGRRLTGSQMIQRLSRETTLYLITMFNVSIDALMLFSSCFSRFTDDETRARARGRLITKAQPFNISITNTYLII